MDGYELYGDGIYDRDAADPTPSWSDLYTDFRFEDEEVFDDWYDRRY